MYVKSWGLITPLFQLEVGHRDFGWPTLVELLNEFSPQILEAAYGFLWLLPKPRKGVPDERHDEDLAHQGFIGCFEGESLKELHEVCDRV